jgi:hypothetical protein
MLNRILASALGLLALCSTALSQVNVVPQVGTTSAVVKQYTYSAVSRALVPAASATDIFCISGSTARAISIKQIRVAGTAGTLVTAPFTLLRRASLDTGGTAATTTALPVATPHLSTDPAAVAVLTAYTANPTIVDTAPLYLRTGWVSLNTTAALVAGVPLEWNAGEYVGWFSRGFDIPRSAVGAAQQYCINLNAVSVTSGVLDIYITWTEQ